VPKKIAVGSQAHKELMCQFFLDSHVPFDPATVGWPRLDEACLARLRSLPFWAEAVTTEGKTAVAIQAWARLQTDPMLRQAIMLQGYEEERHAALLRGLTQHYGLTALPQRDVQPPADAAWAFLCTGYSECFDAFFAFALFALARDSGFFSPSLVDLFEPIMQEEARHILFFVNWEAYMQARRPRWQRPRHLCRGVWGRGLQVWQRVQMARGIRGAGDFTMKGHQTMQADLSPRRFLELCLRENERRLGQYDRRLLRPRLVPTLAQGLCRVLR